MGQITVLVVAPMEVPKLVTIDHTLENLQELVGGNIAATYPWEDRVGLVHADDGIALGYPLNRMLTDEDGEVYDIVHGTFFLCGLGRDNFISIPEDLAKKYAGKFKYPELFFRTLDDHVLAVKVGSGEEPILIA